MKGVWRPEKQRERIDCESKAGVREAVAAVTHRAAPALEQKAAPQQRHRSERAAE